MRHTLCVALVAVAALGPTARAQTPTATATAAPRYEAIDLAPDCSSSRALGINARGDVVGEAWVAGTGCLRPVVWKVGAKRPGPVDLDTLGGPSGHARAITDGGAIVGTADVSEQHTHACLWRGGMAIDLGTLGGEDSDAYAIDAAGDIVGCARTPSGTARAFLYRDGRMRELPGPGDESGATGIGERGVISGYLKPSLTGAVTHAALWRDGRVTDLNPRGASASLAFGLDASGRAVGWALLDERRAFVWSEGDAADLGALGADACRATASAGGAIVGDLTIGEGRRAFVFRDGRATRLPGLARDPDTDQTDCAAYAINAAGWIVGEAEVGGQAHAVMWRPVGGK